MICPPEATLGSTDAIVDHIGADDGRVPALIRSAAWSLGLLAYDLGALPRLRPRPRPRGCRPPRRR